MQKDAVCQGAEKQKKAGPPPVGMVRPTYTNLTSRRLFGLASAPPKKCFASDGGPLQATHRVATRSWGEVPPVKGLQLSGAMAGGARRSLVRCATSRSRW